MTEEHGSYFVPEYSIWPILGALGLSGVAVGSLNFSSLWGAVFFAIGALTLIFMLIGWFSDIVYESRAGLYSEQMNKTFRWGMAWFLFCEAFFFGAIMGALLYVRFATLPWLAGLGTAGSTLTHYVLWPNFQSVWPLLKNPGPNVFVPAHEMISAWGIPALNTLIILLSAISASLALYLLKHGRFAGVIAALVLTMLLGVIFLISQINCMVLLVTQYGLTLTSGIYGSLLYFLMSFHSLHVFVGLLLLMIILLRMVKKQFDERRHFAFEATVWFWNFLTVVWILIFMCLYWS